MSIRWTEEDLKRVRSRIDGAIKAPLEQRNKYGNRKVRVGRGQVFDSEHEYRKWQEFKLEEVAGTIRAVVRQVSLPLPGCKRRIRIDFMIVENNGQIRFVDAKGFSTQTWELKRDQVRDAYGIEISTV